MTSFQCARRAAIAAAAATTLAHASMIHAQQPPADDLDEIIVTSSRVEKELSRVPSAVTVVDQQDIQLGQQQLTLDESLAKVPGVFMQNRHNFAQALRISIRGFGARSPFGIRGIKLLVDDVPATLPDGQGNVDEIDLGSTQRVEVLRGASSSLYGSASAGVISVYTEDGPESPFAQGRVSSGEYGYGQYQLKTGGQTGRLNYLVSASVLDLDGYRDNAYVDRRVMNGKLRFDIGDESELTATVNLLDIPKMGDPGALTAAERAADRRAANPGSLVFDGSESRAQQRIGFVYRTALGENQEITLRNYYTWLDFENKLPFPGSIEESNGGQVAFARFFTGFGAQYTYAGQLLGRDNRLTVGFDAEHQDDDRHRFRNLPGGTRGALTFDQQEEVSSRGLYVQNELSLAETLELTLGVRYDEIEFDVTDRFLLNNSGDDSGRSEFDELSPRIGLWWGAAEGINVYASYSTAFETPTTTEFANPDGGGFNPHLSNQLAESYEIGVKGRLPTRIAIQYDVAAFRIDVEDELVPFEEDGFTGRTFFQNAGDSTRSGIEAGLSAELTPNLSANLAFSRIEAEFDAFRTASESFDGHRIPGVPESQGYVQLKYAHPAGWWGSWDMLHVGEFFADNANLVRADSYQVASLRMGYEGRVGDWRLAPFLGINNLLDEQYDSNVRINAGFGRYFEPAPDRHAYLGMTMRYEFE